MQKVLVGEVSNVDLMRIIQQFKCDNMTLKVISGAPAGLLMMIAAYARPWYGGTGTFRFGGVDTSIKHSSSIRFDEKENKWIKLADMPFARSNATAAIHSATSQIFICGGNDGAHYTIRTMERYSIVSDSWTTKPMPSMKYPRAGHTSVECNGSIFVMGGMDNVYQYMSSCEAFNITNNTWNDLPSMNTTRYQHSSVVDSVGSSGYIYAIGGEHKKDAERYDIMSEKWGRIADLSESRGYHCSVILRVVTDSDVDTKMTKMILVIGGLRNGYISTVEQYNANENKWTVISWNLPQPRCTFSTHLLSGNDNNDNNYDLLLCGGYNGDDISSCVRIHLSYQGHSISEWRCIDTCQLPADCRLAAAC